MKLAAIESSFGCFCNVAHAGCGNVVGERLSANHYAPESWTINQPGGSELRASEIGSNTTATVLFLEVIAQNLCLSADCGECEDLQ